MTAATVNPVDGTVTVTTYDTVPASAVLAYLPQVAETTHAGLGAAVADLTAAAASQADVAGEGDNPRCVLARLVSLLQVYVNVRDVPWSKVNVRDWINQARALAVDDLITAAAEDAPADSPMARWWPTALETAHLDELIAQLAHRLDGTATDPDDDTRAVRFDTYPEGRGRLGVLVRRWQQPPGGGFLEPDPHAPAVRVHLTVTATRPEPVDVDEPLDVDDLLDDQAVTA